MPNKETETRKWKRRFIRSLLRSVQKSLLDQVPKLPASWDGHQLRELIAEQFQRERTNKMRTDMRARMDYRNEANQLP